MAKLDSTLSTLAIALALAAGIGNAVSWMQAGGNASGFAHAADTPAPRSPWAASATGRVEPKNGEIRISALASGEIVEVAVANGDKVTAGDVLVRIDDKELQARLVSALAELEVRALERDEEPQTKGPVLDRRNAQDAVARAERNVFLAQQAFDRALAIYRAGTGKIDDVNAARTKLGTARSELADEKLILERVAASKDMPLMGRLDVALEQARADVSQLYAAIERTRVRAPADGTVLNIFAKAGEIAAPSSERPLLMFGDISTLRVRAELEEREVVKVRVGQGAVVKVDAYPDREFSGTVTSLAASLSAPQIVTRGPRRPNDVEVLEVMVTLDGQPPLLPGMRVDVFFKQDGGQQSALPGGTASAN
jgi:HlyD family secretion protein